MAGCSEHGKVPLDSIVLGGISDTMLVNLNKDGSWLSSDRHGRCIISEVFTARKIHITAFCVITSWSFAGRYQSFGETQSPSSADGSFETLLTTYQTTLRHKAEDFNLILTSKHFKG
jgi:hypothetical protein